MKRLVFDIGGTNMRMALAEDGALGDVVKGATPKDPNEAATQLQDFVSGKDLQDIVGGIAGIIEDGTVADSPNLPSWIGFSMDRARKSAFGVPVRIYNDAELAGLGEAVEGAGKGYASVAYLTIGTGVGGTLIVNGEPLPHAEGLEPGRQIMDYENGRTLESFVGGAALAAEFGMKPELLPLAVYQERTKVLATGIHTLINLWSPDIFILNGPLIQGEPAFHIDEIAAALAQVAVRPLPPLVLAALRDQSALWGGVHARVH